jgi:hypothetical protein
LSINKRGREIRVAVGLLDVTNYVDGLEYGLSATDPQQPLLWSGSLILSEELGVPAAFSFDDRGTVLNDNPLWVRGTRVFIYAKDNSGTERLARTLRILRAFYEEEAGVLTLELGCLLNLVNNRSQPGDASGVASGQLVNRIVAIANTLGGAEIAYPQIEFFDYTVGDQIDFPLIKANGSFVQTAQKALAPEQHFIWVDQNEKIRFKKFEVPATAILNRDRSQYEEVKRESVAEVLPKFVRSIGSKIEYGTANAVPVSTTEDTLATGLVQNGAYYTARNNAGIPVPNANTEFVAQRVVTTFSGDYTTSTVEQVDTFYSRVSTGFSSGIHQSNGAGYLFFQANGFGQSSGTVTGQEEALERELVLSKRERITRFYGPNTQIQRVLVEKFTARDQLELHYAAFTVLNPPTTAFQEEFLTLQTVDTTYVFDPVISQITQTTVETCDLQYGRATDEAPVAGGEFLQCNTVVTSGQTIPINYGPPGVQKEVPFTCTATINTNAVGAREKEVLLEYSTTQDQHCRYARLVADLLIGRKLGYEIALEPTDDLLFGFVPFLRLDVTTDGVNRKYIIDSPSFGFTMREASFRCSGIAVEVV